MYLHMTDGYLITLDLGELYSKCVLAALSPRSRANNESIFVICTLSGRHVTSDGVEIINTESLQYIAQLASCAKS